jgi:trimeric autotransporter adhesin
MRPFFRYLLPAAIVAIFAADVAAIAQIHGGGGGGAGGGVSSVTCGTGLSGGTITTTGTCALLTALPNGQTATTQTGGDNTTKVATDAFVIANTPATPVTVANGGTNATGGKAAANNLSVPYLAKQVNGISLTGSESETIGTYYNVPANIGSQGCVEVDIVSQIPSANTGNAVIVIRDITGTVSGTTSGTTLATATMTKGDTGRPVMDICNGNLSGGATGAQFAFSNLQGSFSQTSAALATSAIDTTSAWTISVNCTTASATTDLCNFYRVRFVVRASYGN